MTVKAGLPASVLFDFDGVIIDSETTSYRAWQEVFSNRGCTLAFERWLDFVGVAAGPDPVTLLEHLSGHPQAGAQSEKDAIHERMTRGLPSRPGVSDTVRMLSKRGVRLYIVSNAASAYIKQHLSRLGLQKYFPDIVSGRDLASRPSKEALYRAGIEALDITRTRTLVIEDSEHGVRAALANDLPVMAFPNRITAHQSLDDLCPVLSYPGALSVDTLGNLYRTL